MAAEISPELLNKCTETMELFNIPREIRQFCQEAMNLEYEMSSEPGDVIGAFKSSDDKEDDDDDDRGGHDDDDNVEEKHLSTKLDAFSSAVQATLTKFKQWTERLKKLNDTCKLLPPLKFTEGKVKQLKAPYYLRAGEMSIQEGDLIEIVGWSEDEQCLKVKVGSEKEGQIPLLSLVVPSSDFNLTSLVERLHVLILCSWFECFRFFYQRIFKLLLILLEVLAYTYPKNVSTHASGPKTSKDLHVLKKIVARLEADSLVKRESTERSEAPQKFQGLVLRLSKAYKNYKVFEKLLKNFKVPDDSDKLRPLCIFDKLSEFQSRVPKDKPVKYYKTKIVIESVETREEILHFPSTDSSSTVSEGSAQQTKVESERLTSSSQEVQKRFVVKAVRDPRTGKDISLDDAMKEGVLDMSRGFYIDPSTGDSRPIATAMNEGLIKVEAVTETVTKQKKEEMGIITVKSLVSENRDFKIVQAVDPITAEKLSPEVARKRGWLTDRGYKVETRVVPMDEAIEIGWVQVEYLTPEASDPVEEPKYEARSYLIKSVSDQRRSRMVGFNEAVSLGIVDVEHGCYVDSVGWEKISLDEAIRRGLVKGRRLKEGEDPGALAVDPDNRVVAGNLAKFKAAVGAVAASVRAKSGKRNDDANNDGED